MTDDQRFASRRPDVMVYQTDILTEDITLTGPLTADLFVSTTGTDADYIVKLIDVFLPTPKQKNQPMLKFRLVVTRCLFAERCSEENIVTALKNPNLLCREK